MVNSRAKGRAFEQSIANMFREWLGEKWTITRNSTDRQKGQTSTDDAGEFRFVGPFTFPFAVECKASEKFQYGHLFETPIPGPFLSFWQQASDQATIGRRRPMLILKRNLGEILCAVEFSDAEMLIGATSPRPMLQIPRRMLSVFPFRALLDTDARNLIELVPLPPTRSRA